MSWLIQFCGLPQCGVPIRVQHDRALQYPKCKWCDKGTSYLSTRSWPDGMPDPVLPWPWLADEERERRLKLPYWQERFKTAPPTYAPWVRA